jgi:hypothetical protein
VSESGDRSSVRAKTFATVAAIVVAVFGLLGSTVWGPPICRAVGVCTDATPESTPSGAAAGVSSTSATSPTRRDRETGYPAAAADYCEAFVRAWQDQYEDRAAELSTAQIAATVFKIAPPLQYRNDSGPTGNGATCTISDTSRGNAKVVQLFITKPTGQPGAITSATI